MEQEVNIRFARKEDSDRINELFIQMNNYVNKQNRRNGIPYDTSKIIEGYKEGYLDTFYNNDSRFIFVAEMNGEVIGYLSCVVFNSENEESYLYLGDFSVDERYRGNAVGIKLMEEANSYASENGIDSLRLCIDSRNEISVRSYNNLGFKELTRDTNYRLIMGKRVEKKEVKTL